MGDDLIQFIPPLWLKIAIDELGVHEKPGASHEARIIEYHSYTALQATSDEVPWCSSFINFCIARSGLDPTYSAMARSWLSWGVPLAVPATGCVVVLKRGTQAWQGHVALYLGDNQDGTIKVIGGNQNDSVSIKNYKKYLVLGYRWP